MSHSFSASLKDYLFHGIIGSGAFSTCYKVSSKSNGKASVWKAIDYGWMSWKDQEVMESLLTTEFHVNNIHCNIQLFFFQILLREVSVLSAIKHRNVVKFYSFMNNNVMCNMYIQMEYCSDGTLMDYIKKKDKYKIMIEENFIWDVLLKLLKALKWLNLKLPNMKMIHWIVTPSDIFLENGNIKLGGFYLNEQIYSDYDHLHLSADVPSLSRLLYTSPVSFSNTLGF